MYIIMAISEITPSAVKLDKLVSRVADGDIKIPAFHRHFVWNQGQVIELLDSLYQVLTQFSKLLLQTFPSTAAFENV